jgi:serine-type D-Ala-D-Ala carboxypeptidase (penicillin-binding protein 5/6)
VSGFANLPRAVQRRRSRAAIALAVLAALAGGSAAGAPPKLEARAYYVQSGYDGTVLAEWNASERRAPASITKLMTVLVALEHADLDEVVTVPPAAAGLGESTIFLRAGEQVSVHDLAIGALVPSANDAATALALHVGGGSIPRFVGMMNEKARRLGLRDTHFVNPHGLDEPGHVSSARDAVRLVRAALRNSFIRRSVSLEHATLANGRAVVTTDDLLSRYAPLLGGKTGHTAGAGWSQVAAARSDGVTVYASVLGVATRSQRNDELETLLRWALREYRRVAAVATGRTYARVRTGYDRPDVRLVALSPVVRPVRVGRPLVERIVAPAAIALPVERGRRLGEVRVYDGRRLVAASPLVAAEAVSEPGALGKAGWYAKRTVHHLAGLVW